MTVMAKVVQNDKSEEKSVETSSEEELVQTSSAENDDDDGSHSISNVGWADSIAKILKTNKPKGKKTLVLSKAKKLTDVKRTRTKSAGFQVESFDGAIREEEVEVEEEQNEEQPPRKKKKELPNLRVKPNVLEKDKERTLIKIATKGVVQLFNAVKNQQKDINKKIEEAGPLEVKKEKVLKSIDKRQFLDVLMGEKSHTVQEKKTEGSTKISEGSTWSVLRDDFMMGGKLKDWDKQLEEESEVDQQIEMESD